MKNLLKLGDLTEQEITAILNTADQLKFELKNGIEHHYCKNMWLLPGEAAPSEAAQAAVKELEGYTLRLVREVGELIEKINIADAGLEDTIVEMCKWVTRRELSAKNPAAAKAPLKFLRTEGADHDLVFAFPLEGNMQLVNVGFNVYEDARGIIQRNPSVKPSEGFASVNSEWLERFFQ